MKLESCSQNSATDINIWYYTRVREAEHHISVLQYIDAPVSKSVKVFNEL